MNRPLYFTILFFILFSLKSISGFSTPQKADLLIGKKDTVPILSNPLEPYFEKVGSRDIPGLSCHIMGSNCWKGYQAIWELEGDSLFLNKVRSCYPDSCPNTADLQEMFGTKRPFARWYSDTLIIPWRAYHWMSDYGDSSVKCKRDLQLIIQEGEKDTGGTFLKDELKEDVKKECKKKDLRLTAKYRTISMINRRVREKDFYFSTPYPWDTTYSCQWFRYRFFFDEEGKVEDVDLVLTGSMAEDSTNKVIKMIGKALINQCCGFLEGALEPMKIEQLDPPLEFDIKMGIEYDEEKGRFEEW